MSAAARAELYYTLAEVLTDTPPDWMTEVGSRWPLTRAAEEVAMQEDQAALASAVTPLSCVFPESLDRRTERFNDLCSGFAESPIAMHESLICDGRLAGPSMAAVGAIYQAAGLNVSGSELPDHATLELAFLGYTCEQEMTYRQQAIQWQQVRRRFIKRHAGRWLPSLGQELAATGDPVYGPIGNLLNVVLSEKKPIASRSTKQSAMLPVLPAEDLACTLCGFCVQVCPTRALAIRETEHITALVLSPTACIGCSRCVRTCMTNSMHLANGPVCTTAQVLYESPRAHCPICGEPTVSEAEIDAIAAQIGTPGWLYYCLECRTQI
jgi:ferredoxin